MGTNKEGDVVEYLLYTERRDGTDRYTLVDVERNSIVVMTTYKKLVDWCIAYGVRKIEPAQPLSVNSRQRVLR